MLDFLQTPTAQAIVLTAVLAIMILVGFWIVTSFRGFDGDDRPSASELMTNFQELHDRGDISEAEYRKLKTALRKQLQQEFLNDDDETG